MYKNLRTIVNMRSLLQQSPGLSASVTTCLCGRVYRQKSVLGATTRIHSTASDQHRQKVVLETSTPKIVIRAPDIDKERSAPTLDAIRARLDPYVKLARLDKPIGIYLLFWPCSWSIALASLPASVPLHTTLGTAGLFAAGACVMRAAGCTTNDYWDRHIDRQVERTKDRPLASGAISERRAIAFLAAQLTLGLGILLQLNCYSVLLGASSLALVVTYPLAKRFTDYPQLFLGATFNWGALLGYSAIQGHLEPAICLPLYAGAIAWTVIYDTIYAHQDKNDDARIGLKSTALTFGAHTKPALAATLCASVLCLSQAGRAAGLQAPYYLALAVYTAHIARQIYSLNPDCPADCAQKFKSNSWVGLVILLGILGGGYSQYIENRAMNQGKDAGTARSCVFG